MDLTEKLIVEAIRATGQEPEAPLGRRPRSTSRRPLPGRPTTSCSPQHTGVAPDDAAGHARPGRAGSAWTRPASTSGRGQERGLRGAWSRSSWRGPIFVIDYPASICPLTKRKAGNPAVAERFELFVQGMEVANAYTELNDPGPAGGVVQQAVGRSAGRGVDGPDGPRFPPGVAARDAAGRRAGHRHRPAGDAVDRRADASAR